MVLAMGKFISLNNLNQKTFIHTQPKTNTYSIKKKKYIDTPPTREPSQCFSWEEEVKQ